MNKIEKSQESKTETKVEEQISMPDQRWFNRRERRLYMKRAGILKARKNMNLTDYLEDVRKSIEAGRKLHDEYTEMQEKFRYEQLERKESDIRQSLKDRGFKKKEIESRINKWHDSIFGEEE